MSNVFSLYNMTTTLDKDTYPIESGYKQRTNSIFASVEIGWKSMLYMTLTGRNDWDSALINTDIFEMYLEKFKEPTRPLPKHIWNKLSSEDKKDHNSTCFDKKDP